MRYLPAPLVFLVLIGCTPKVLGEEVVVAEPLPTSEEVIAYVSSRWSDDYGRRFAREVSRRGETAELLAVTNVSCSYRYNTPDCEFQVAARFDGELEQRRKLSETFGRDAAGHLEAILVLTHDQPR
jgi:hypothetical protein